MNSDLFNIPSPLFSYSKVQDQLKEINGTAVQEGSGFSLEISYYGLMFI